MADWPVVANEIELALPSTSGLRYALGASLLDRLRTYGGFRDALEDQRDLDARIAAAHTSAEVGGSPAIPATLTLGGLTLTARPPGEQGNDITVSVTDGAAAGFTVTQIDPAHAEQHRQDALGALSGNITLASDPTIAALQQSAIAVLAGLDQTTLNTAADLINERWYDYRNARTGLANPRTRQKLVDTMNGLGIDTAVQDSALQTWDDRDSSFANAAETVFTLTVSRGSTTEAFPEIVPGYQFNIGASALVEALAWDGATRPANGSYQFSGGVDATAARGGKATGKPLSEYVYRIDAERSFTLVELREIVAQAVEGGEEWLAG
jgi:hypothetical protein